MTLEDFIQTNPTKEEIAFQLCAVANYNIINIDESYAWEELSKLGGLKKEDFWDDKEETVKKMGGEAVTHHGIVNWKLKIISD
jgi:hypothetical protein